MTLILLALLAADIEDFDELPFTPRRATLRAPPPAPSPDAFAPVQQNVPPEDAPTATDASTHGSLFQMKQPASQPATAEAREPTPEDKMRKGELSMLGVTEFLNDQNFAGVGLGYLNLNSVHYATARPTVDLHFFDNKLHMNFGALLNFTIFDPNGGGFKVSAAHRFRTKDWDEWQEYFKVLRRIQWGRKEDHFFVRLGTVGATSIGHGGLMRRYNNNMLANTTRVALEVDAYNDYVGGEAFMSDITLRSRVLGALGFVKPLGWMSNPIARSFSLGMVYAGDLGAPTSLQRDAFGVVKTDNVDNPLYNQGMMHGLGGSIEVKPVRIGDMIDIKGYVEFNQLFSNQQKYGNGFTFGALGRFNFGPIALRARLEYRNLGSQYMPSYFDSFYEIQKLQVVTYNPSTTAPTKLDFLRSLQWSGRRSNFYGEVTFSWVDKLAISAAYEGGGDALLQSFLLHAEFSAFSWLRFFATYHKRNFSDGKTLFAFQQNDLLYAQMRIEILPILFLNGRAVKTFVWDDSVDFGLGGLRNTWDYRADIELGWQW